MFPGCFISGCNPDSSLGFPAILGCSSLAVFCLSGGRFSKTASYSKKAVSLSITNSTRTRQLLASIAHTGHIQGQGTGCKNSRQFAALLSSPNLTQPPAHLSGHQELWVQHLWPGKFQDPRGGLIAQCSWRHRPLRGLARSGSRESQHCHPQIFPHTG